MSKRGVSLIEVLVAMIILGGVLLAFLMYQKNTYRIVRITEDTSALTRALVVIEKNIMDDMPYIPPQEQDDGLVDSPKFTDSAVSGLRCYGKFGNLLPGCSGYDTDIGKTFKVEYFKVALKDRSFDSNSPLSRIPVSLIRFRVTYKIDREIRPPLYFSRLSTEVLKY